MRLVLVAGTTRTAGIEGISAAGAHPDLLRHTPSADAEILTYGRPVAPPEGEAHPTPVSPTGCPTPAVVTRAVREVLGFDVTVLDAGLGAPSSAPTVDLGAVPGNDVREGRTVPDARGVFERARRLGASLPGPLLVGETVPGGTTTALGVLRALGYDHSVCSSLPDNPLDLKERVVAEGLAAAGLDDGTGDPIRAVRAVGDPVLTAVAGLVVGASEAGTEVTLAGGTQLVAAGALVRHWSDAPLDVATTSFVADATPDLATACADLDLSLTVTDPGFTDDHVAMARYLAGEGKEGVGMGGVLALADREDSLPAVRERIVTVYDRLLGDEGGEP
ncbi:nicotinate-nucleotide--dimethylbenzimidazole phosphoribosyltransferase [Halomarina litorea]|uniref:nicotinate-nucleotide--dimethylbenzimidazole phosphoribosyltransferase n=1 Tax=Halomarina litorea TaxID=2961595 RepID=UPI0020C3A09A|nr:TIGR00303 family protein [Halomarina sp. BCD28]